MGGAKRYPSIAVCEGDGFREGLNASYELQGFGGSLGQNAALPDASPPPELWVASSSQSCRIPYSSSGVLYSSGAASNFSPLAARVPSLYPPVICPSRIFVSSPLCKNISLHPSGKSSLHIRAIPSHKRGVSRSSGNAGWDAVDAAASCVRRDCRTGDEPVSDHRHADERCCSVRRSRVVLTPRRWRQVRGCWVGPTGLRHNVSPWTTVAKEPGHRGEREGNR
jgi:hypothetical protein